MTGYWMRAETRRNEFRAPLAPDDARSLVDAGVRVVVEESRHRCFDTYAYQQAGCSVEPAGSWPDAPADFVVLGLKELTAAPDAIVGRHVFFAHAYHRQPGAERLLSRFASGGGTLLDLESLVDRRGRRLATFSDTAGYVGAALGVQLVRGEIDTSLSETTLDALHRELGRTSQVRGSAVVAGALGRAGRGACRALARAQWDVTRWDVCDENIRERPVLTDHDLLVNTIAGAVNDGSAVVGDALAESRGRLTTVVDVSCDIGGPRDLLRLCPEPTSFDEPVYRTPSGYDVVAIDNLPSLVPVAASASFSGQLLPLLHELHRDGETSAVWARARAEFERHVRTS